MLRRAFGLLCVVFLSVWVVSQPAEAVAAPGAMVRLPGHTLAVTGGSGSAVERGTARRAAVADDPLSVTVVFRRRDEAGFQALLSQLYDPSSPEHRRWWTQDQLTERFGPTEATYAGVRRWLEHEGFTLGETSSNRMTLTMTGTRSLAQTAFAVRIEEFQSGGRTFRANVEDPSVPAEFADDIQAILGLSDLAQPDACGGAGCPLEWFESPLVGLALIAAVVSFFAYAVFRAPPIPEPAPAAPANAQNSWSFPVFNQLIKAAAGSGGGLRSGRALADWTSLTGLGQTVGVVAYDNFHVSDLDNWLVLSQLPSSQMAKVSQVHVGGGFGPPGANQAEVLLDIAAITLTAPNANIVVYDAPFAGQGSEFQVMFNKMILDGVDIISNSWAYCESQTTLADVESIDSILAGGAASGIATFNASGDTNDSCLDGSPNTVHVPASSPHATAVGATRSTLGPGFTYGSEVRWDAGQGGSGFGVSRFFARPDYQDGLVTGAFRSVPDVMFPGAPDNGLLLCIAAQGGCPDGRIHGGTSLAAPRWAGMAALLNEANGTNTGTVTPALYAAAEADQDAFHSAQSMGTDFAHAGLGSPNLNRLSLAMRAALPGAGTALKSNIYVTAYPDALATAGGIPADGVTQAAVIVQIRDTDGNIVTGKAVTLSGNVGHSATITPLVPITRIDDGSAVFLVKDATAERVVVTAFNVTDNVPISATATIDFIGPPAVAANIVAFPTNIAADGVATSTITVTLQDAQGQGAGGKLVNLSQGPGHSQIVGPSPALTDSAGQTTFTVQSSVAETVTYTAIDVTDGNLPVPGSAQVIYGGTPAEACEVGPGVAAPGWSVTTWASGFPHQPGAGFNCVGPIGLTFGVNGELWVTTDAPHAIVPGTGGQRGEHLYRFGPDGGIASAATRLPAYYGFLWCPTGVAWSKDGQHLYMARQGCGYAGFGDVFEVDPTTGALLRNVADAQTGDLTGCMTALAVDPISGDLFGSRPCSGSGAPDIVRISNPQSANPPVTVYASPGYTDGIAFAPDGTMYAAVGAGPLVTDIVRINGTSHANPGAFTVIATVATTAGIADGLAFATTASNTTGFLAVDRNDGVITLVDLSQQPPTQTDIVTGASRGDFVAVGPDGCLYATMTDRILKVMKDDGSCPFSTTNPFPTLSLAPASIPVDPPQGTLKTFTTKLSNVPNPAELPVLFTVSGANPRVQVARANAQGEASFTYTGIFTGKDSVAASVVVDAKTVRSNVTRLTWIGGKHTTFTTLNGVPLSGELSGTTTLSATLTDLSVVPPVAITGALLHFTVNGQECDGATNGQGEAACEVTLPGPIGIHTLNVSFAGDTSYLPSNDARSFSIRAAAGSTCPAPSPVLLTVGATGLIWTGGDLSSAGQPSQFDTELPASVSAVFEWSDDEQQFKFWFRGFPPGFNNLAVITGGGYYFLQSGQLGLFGLPNPGSFSLPGPGTGATFETVPGATSELWQGTGWPLTGGPHPIDTLPAQVTAVFQWSNSGQHFQFWFRGFPHSFQTLTEGLQFCGHYFFQDGAGGHTIAMD